MNLKGKTALVTGGAVRIGRAICEELAGRGCNVAIHYGRSKAEAESLAVALRDKGVQAWALKTDLGDGPACDSLVEEAWKATGGLQILVNNASVFHKDLLMSATEEKFLAELRINALAPMMLVRAFARRCAQEPGDEDEIRGKVVNLLDRRVAGNDVGCLPYLLSKKMLAEFTKNAAVELAPSIAVNGVAPGAILPPAGAAPGKTFDLAGPTLLRYPCRPQDVARAVVFLLESDGITGQILFVDAGQHLIGR